MKERGKKTGREGERERERESKRPKWREGGSIKKHGPASIWCSVEVC